MKDKPKFVEVFETDDHPHVFINVNNITYIIEDSEQKGWLYIGFIGNDKTICVEPSQGEKLLEKLKELAGES